MFLGGSSFCPGCAPENFVDLFLRAKIDAAYLLDLEEIPCPVRL